MSEPQYCLKCDSHHNGDCPSGWITDMSALQNRVRELEAECSSMGRLLQSGVVIKSDEYSQLRKVVAAARNFDYELKPDEYRRGTSVWIDGDEMKELNLALEELDRAERENKNG